MAGRNRGRKKPHLRDLSRQHATGDESMAVMAAIETAQSPITVAILGAALVEQELETILRKKIKRTDDETWERLTGESGPLGSFWQKAELAYALKLFDDVTRDNLNSIRHIRNAFAHAKRLINFENDLVVRELRTLTIPASRNDARYRVLKRIREHKENDISPQKAFANLCEAVAIVLIRRDIRGTAAGTRNKERRIKRLHRLSLAAGLFTYKPGRDFLDLPEFLKGPLGPLGIAQTFDPEQQEPKGLLYKPPVKSSKNDGNNKK
jgi:hypothetical protein